MRTIKRNGEIDMKKNNNTAYTPDRREVTVTADRREVIAAADYLEASRTLKKKLLLLAVPTVLGGIIGFGEYGPWAFGIGCLAALLFYFPLRARELLHLGLVGTLLSFVALFAAFAGLESLLGSELWVLAFIAMVIADVVASAVKLKRLKSAVDDGAAAELDVNGEA